MLFGVLLSTTELLSVSLSVICIFKRTINITKKNESSRGSIIGIANIDSPEPVELSSCVKWNSQKFGPQLAIIKVASIALHVDLPLCLCGL